MANKTTYQYMWKIPKTFGHSPCARWGHTATMITNKGHSTLLLFGGWDGQNMLSDCQLLDLVENEWIEVPPMNGKIPTPRAGHSSTVINPTRNEILVLGGGNGQHYLSLARNDVHILNTETMTWSQPNVTSQVKVYIKDDLIVNENLINQVSDEPPTTPTTDEDIPLLIGTQTAEITDTGFGTPSQRAALKIASSPIVTTVKEVYPAPRSRHTAVLVQKTEHEPLRVILFAGGGKNKIFDDLWILDVEKMEWYQPHTTGTKPSPRWGHTANVIGDKMYVFGGVYDSKMMNDLYELDTNTYEWKQIILPKTTPIPAPRAAHTTTAVHGRYLFILWGGDDDRFLDDLFVYDLHKNIGKRLTFKTPKARCAHSALLWDRDNGNGGGPLIYVFGGGNGSIRFKELYMLDTEIAIKKSGFELVKNQIVEKVVTPPPVVVETVAPLAGPIEEDFPPPPPPPLPTAPQGNNNYMFVRTEIKVDDSVNYPANRGQFHPPPPHPPHQYNRIQLPTQQPLARAKRRRGSTRRSSEVYTTKDAKEVTNWLVGLGLGRYAGMFVHEEIDMECLPLLAESDLFRIGVSKYGPRKKILAAAREVQEEEDDEEEPTEHEPVSPPSTARGNGNGRNAKFTNTDQLSQSINNLAMTCEGLKESMKSIVVAMQMMMMNQQQMQQQMQFMMSNNVPSYDQPSPRTPPTVIENEDASPPPAPPVPVLNGGSVQSPKKIKQKTRRRVVTRPQQIIQDDEEDDFDKKDDSTRKRSGSWYEISKQDEEEQYKQ